MSLQNKSLHSNALLNLRKFALITAAFIRLKKVPALRSDHSGGFFFFFPEAVR